MDPDAYQKFNDEMTEHKRLLEAMQILVHAIEAGDYNPLQDTLEGYDALAITDVEIQHDIYKNLEEDEARYQLNLLDQRLRRITDVCRYFEVQMVYDYAFPGEEPYLFLAMKYTHTKYEALMSAAKELYDDNRSSWQRLYEEGRLPAYTDVLYSLHKVQTYYDSLSDVHFADIKPDETRARLKEYLDEFSQADLFSRQALLDLTLYRSSEMLDQVRRLKKAIDDGAIEPDNESAEHIDLRMEWLAATLPSARQQLDELEWSALGLSLDDEEDSEPVSIQIPPLKPSGP